jgi:hypothetical protein
MRHMKGRQHSGQYNSKRTVAQSRLFQCIKAGQQPGQYTELRSSPQFQARIMRPRLSRLKTELHCCAMERLLPQLPQLVQLPQAEGCAPAAASTRQEARPSTPAGHKCNVGLRQVMPWAVHLALVWHCKALHPMRCFDTSRGWPRRACRQSKTPHSSCAACQRRCRNQ